MTFATVGDLLSEVQNFYYRTSNQYTEMRKTVGNQKVTTLLDRILAKRESMTEALDQYLKTAPEAIMAYRFKSPPDQELMRTITTRNFHTVQTVEDLVRTEQHFGERLLTFYDRLQDQALSDDVTDLFENLRDMQARYMKDVAWNGTRQEDV